TKLRGLLQIITAAAEFDDLPIRHHEESLLRRIHDRVAVKVDLGTRDKLLTDPHVKANLLLQAHFSRLQLPPDLESDQRVVLGKVLRLVQAAVDVISTNGWLSPALAAMELSQMCVQAVWDRDPWLRQVPHVTQDAVQRLKAKGVTTVVELLDMEDADREDALQIDRRAMAEVATYVNRYPNVELAYEIVGDEPPRKGEPVVLKVQLERVAEDDDDDDEDEEGGGGDGMEVDGGGAKRSKAAKQPADVGPVVAPLYPQRKDEGWWVVVGDGASNSLLAIKRAALQQRALLRLEFACPGLPGGDAGQLDLKLYLMCDAYAGVDQEYDLQVEVAEGEAEEEEEDDEEEEEDGDEKGEGEAEAGEGDGKGKGRA
ncbi:hypothetical protein HK405_014248, partial [Cladochytrium tenue]